MFLGNDILDFINKIIDLKDTKTEEKVKLIKEFKNYLKLTKMADEQTMNCVDKVVKCLPEICTLKEKMGFFDLNMILKEDKKTIEKNDETRAKKLVRTYEEKHYKHYQSDTSDSCGSGSRRTTNNRC